MREELRRLASLRGIPHQEFSDKFQELHSFFFILDRSDEFSIDVFEMGGSAIQVPGCMCQETILNCVMDYSLTSIIEECLDDWLLTLFDHRERWRTHVAYVLRQCQREYVLVVGFVDRIEEVSTFEEFKSLRMVSNDLI